MMDIFDPLRKVYVRRTPEEEVRQMLIRWLIEKQGCPKTLMASEYSFRFNSLQYRSDIVVFDRDLSPLLLVECKAPSVRLDFKVTEQVTRYIRMLPVRYILISNGRSSVILVRDGADETFRQIQKLPPYSEMTAPPQNPRQ